VPDYPSIEPAGQDDVSGSTARYRRSISGSLSAVLARGLGVALSFVVIPVVLRSAGPERFGIWATIVSMTVVMTFADLGIGNGLVTMLGGSMARGDVVASQRLTSSGFAAMLYVSVGLVAVLPLLFVVPWAEVFDVRGTPVASEVMAAMAVFGAVLILTVPLTLGRRIQLGIQESHLDGVWLASGTALGAGGLLVAAHLHASLPWLVGASMGGPLVAHALQFWRLIQRRPSLRPRLQLRDSATVRMLARLGLSFFLLQLSGSLLFSFDNLIVASLLGANVVSDFAVQAQPFIWINGLVGVLLIPLWPAYAEVFATGDIEWARTALIRSVFLVGTAAAIASGLVVVFADTLFGFWVGGTVALDRELLLGFAAVSVMAAVGSALSIFLNAAGLLRFQVATGLITSAVALIGKVTGAVAWGSAGVVGATAIAYFAISLIPTSVYVVRPNMRSPKS
jgi:O-antigen/teichoic acid export membrane protein